MSHSIHVEPEANLLYVRYAAPVTAAGIRDVILAGAGADYEALGRRVHDFRGARTDLGNGDVRALAGLVREMRDGLELQMRRDRRLALLVDDDLMFGISAMFSALAADGPTEPSTTGVFRSWPEAVDWLGLGADYPDLSGVDAPTI